MFRAAEVQVGHSFRVNEQALIIGNLPCTQENVRAHTMQRQYTSEDALQGGIEVQEATPNPPSDTKVDLSCSIAFHIGAGDTAAET